MKERQLGWFYVSSNVLDDPLDYINLFYGVVVMGVEVDSMFGRIKYVCASKYFSPVEFGKIIPEYRPIFRDGDIHPEWAQV